MKSLLDKVLDLRAGLCVGAVAALLGAGLAARWPTRFGGRPAPLAGILVCAATVVALAIDGRAPAGLVAGLALLALAGGVGGLGFEGRPSLGRTSAAVAAGVPGALVVAFAGDLPDHSWPAVAVVAAIAVAGPLVAAADAWLRAPAVGPTLLALSAAGVFVTVPDTERAVALAGSALAVAALGWPSAMTCLGRAGAYAGTGLVVWVAVVDGRGRPGSVVGAVASLGLLVAWPIGVALRRRSSPIVVAGWRAILGVVMGHAFLVGFVTRVAGDRHSAGAAAVLAGGALLLAVATVAALNGPAGAQVVDPA